MENMIKKGEKLFDKSIEIIEKLQLSNGGIFPNNPGIFSAFIHPREHIMCTLAFIELGMFNNAKLGLSFIQNGQLEDGSYPQKYSQDAQDSSDKDKPIDINGLVLYAFGKYLKATDDHKFVSKNWGKLKKNVEYILKNIKNEHNLIFANSSVYDYPAIETGYEIWANGACCGGLFEALYIAHRLNKKAVLEKWQNHTTKLKTNILKYLWNSKEKSFVKNIRTNDSASVVTFADVSTYAVANFGMLEDTDVHVRVNVERIQDELWHQKIGGICKFPKIMSRNAAGFGSWSVFTLMIIRHYIKIREKKQADKLLAWIINIAHDNLLPEHVSTKENFEDSFFELRQAGILTKENIMLYNDIRINPAYKKKKLAYSNCPSSWAHAEFIKTWLMYKTEFINK